MDWEIWLDQNVTFTAMFSRSANKQLPDPMDCYRPGGILPIVDYTGSLCQKGVPFLS